MTYRELLELYKTGELELEQRKKVEKDIERQEAISDYLYEQEDIPFKKEVKLSPDLLQGKRQKVLNTALNYYYQTACEIAEETRFAREYGKRANRTKVVKTEK